MLCLTRGKGESIVIGDGLAKITVTSVHGHYVKLMIEWSGTFRSVTCNHDERVFIRNETGDPIASALIVDVRSNTVRLGIEAPGLEVHRQEVYHALKASGTQAKPKALK